MLIDTVNLKLELLCNGVSFTRDFLEYYQAQMDHIEKRRAYGTGDSIILSSSIRTPQEIILEGQIISAVNHNPNSDYRIALEQETPVLKHGKKTIRITFPRRPISYGKYLSNGELFEQHITVYGNSTLGIFSPGHCYYFNDGHECKFMLSGISKRQLI